MAAGCANEPPCLETSRAISLEESTGLGQTLQELLNATTLEGTASMLWYEDPAPLTFDGAGTTTDVTWSVNLDESTARFVENEQNPDNTDAAYYLCPDFVEVRGLLDVSTADGTLDEQGLEVLIRYQANEAIDAGDSAGDLFGTWALPQQSTTISSLGGTLSSGLSTSDGTDYLSVVGRDSLDDDVAVSIGTVSVVELDGAVGVGTGTLGCGSISGDGCPTMTE